MFLEDIFNQPVSDRANYCRKELESLSLKSLRKLAVEADSLNSTCDSMHSRWYAMIKDVFFTKKFKPKKETKKKYPKVRVFVVFDNKGIDLIKLSSIINDPNVLDHGLLESRTGNFNITQKNEKTDALIFAVIHEFVYFFF